MKKRQILFMSLSFLFLFGTVSEAARPLKVSITSPTSGTTYTTAQTVPITASASGNGVAKVEFYDGTTLKGTDTASPYTYAWSITSTNNGTHSWTAKAYDTVNSTTSTAVSLTVNITTTTDTTPPTGSATINSNAVYAKSLSVTLALSASDASGVAQMCISNTTSCSAWEAYATSKAWTLTTGDGTKTVYAWFKDSVGNATPAATPFSDTIFLDTVPPQCSVVINSGASYTKSTSVTLTLSATDPNPGSGLSQMCVSNASSSCSSWVAYGSSMAWTLTTGDGAKTVYAWFKDSAGNVTATPSITSDSIILDTAAPSAPTGLTGTAASCSQINLSWTASTDTGGSALKGYNVYRNGSYLKQVTTTSTSDTGLSGSTVYSYTVSAVDNAGNQSAQSNPLGMNTPSCDTTAPTVPTGLTGTAASCSQTNLSWAASTDTGGSGLKGYNVYRNSSFIKQVTTTSTSDTGLTESTSYSYNIKAVDNAGNQSAMSNTATAGTPACTVSGWAKQFGGTSVDVSMGVAMDLNGDMVVTGRFKGTADFGGGPLTSAGGTTDMYLAKYTPAGAQLWSRSFGSTGGEYVESIAVDDNGDVVVTGTADFGGGPLTSAGGYDIFIAKYSGVNGNHIWSKGFGSSSDDTGYGVAVDAGGNVVVTGYFQGTVNFGGGALASYGWDMFVAKYSPAGNHLWSKRFWNTSGDMGYSAAVDNSGDVIITGAFMGAIDFGGGSLTSAGGWDVYVAKLEGQDGTHLWSKRFGGSGSIANDRGEDIAVDVNGDVVLTGYYYGGGAADFGGGPLTGYGVDDIFVAKYSGVDGSHLWSKGVGGSSYDHANSIALDDNGDVLVTGDFQLTANFGGAPLTSSGTMDIFVAKYNGTDGSHLWSKRFGGSSDDKGRDVVAANGNVFVTGDFWNTVDFGYGPLTSAGSTDIFLLKIVP